VGLGGLAVEWGVLGNGPQSNAFQPGMFGMWTTFCFGPRVLSRPSPPNAKGKRRFWIAFGITAIPLTASILLTPDPKARLVVAVLGLTASYMIWSVWLLGLGWSAGRRCKL
ncbi:MAG: hypothetical protein ACC661_11305, partial [Verrucomicrobiales bacterium]